MNVQRIRQFLKSNLFQIVAVVWAVWLTWTIQNTREDLDVVYSQVSSLEESVSASDHEQDQNLEDIKKTLTRIDNRLPY